MYRSSLSPSRSSGAVSSLDRCRPPRRFPDYPDNRLLEEGRIPVGYASSATHLSGLKGHGSLYPSPLRSPTSPLSGPSGGYRYASVDRLAQRQKIYEGGPPSTVLNLTSSASAIDLHNHLAALSAKRELFFRDGHNSTTANSTTAATPASSAVPTTTTALSSTLKESLYSRDRERDASNDREKESSNATKDMDGYVGFANLPNQVYRKAVKRGFEFTLMVVGESGLGKSTLVNSLFLSDIFSNEYPGPSQRIKKTMQVEATKLMLKEGGVNLTLTIVDTPGFGDAVDNSDCWQPIINYIENKYEEYLNEESRVHRSSIPDSRVHCCLYFIGASGHGLKPLDIEFMKRLHDKVNVIPLIAKADTMTSEECLLFKRTILNEIAQNKIKIYEFPECEDEEENKLQKPLKERVPFAVVGSNAIVEVNGKKVRGRKYPWGVAEVENMEHCDFIALRNMLIRTHMQDLKDVTNIVHYENYRCRKLGGVGDGKQVRVSNNFCPQRMLNTYMVFWNPLAQMEEEKKEHELKMKRMEQEMEQVFEMKVKEKMQKLKESEADLQRRHEQMKKSLEQQRQEMSDKRQTHEKEKSAFDTANKDIEDALRRMSVDTNSKEHLDGKEKKKEKKKGLF